MSDEETLQKLARKLLETFHLNVPERRTLPDGKMPFTTLVSAAGDILSESGWLPKDWRRDCPFDGVLIEKRSDRYMLHKQHEVGVERFSNVQSTPAASLQEAVRSFVKRTFGDDIDGVVVDWGR